MRIRKNRGKLVLDYLNQQGERKQPTFDNNTELEKFVSTQLPKLKRLDPTEDAAMTVGEYVIRFLARIKPTVEPATYAGYESVARMHILEAHGQLELRALRRTDVYDFLAARLASHSKNTVRRIQQVYQSALDWAVIEELVLANPVRGLAKQLKLIKTRKAMAKNIKAMNKEQLGKFLASTLKHAPDLYPLFLFMSRNGFRPGEAYGASRANLNLDAATFYVDEALCSFDNEMGGTKTDGSEGMVSLTPQTVRVLREHVKTLPVGGRFLFPSRTGKPHDHRTMNRRLKRLLSLTEGLELHYTPHCLRHTYASQSLAEGENLSFVQQQLRHASITLTADLYGKWLPKLRMLPANRLDDDVAA